MGFLASLNPFTFGKVSRQKDAAVGDECSFYPEDWVLILASKKAPVDYDTVLSRLSSEIAEAKTNLSEIRLRQRRISLLVTVYGVLLWLTWVALWWIGGIPWRMVGVYDYGIAQLVELAIIVFGPVG